MCVSEWVGECVCVCMCVRRGERLIDDLLDD